MILKNYIFQHFQDSEKIHQIDTESDLLTIDDDSLYPNVNNDIEYGLFEDLVESYHLDSQIKDDFQCDQDCYTQCSKWTKDNHLNICTHNYQHIAQNINDLSDNTQQNNLYSSEESTSSFTDDTDTHCNYSISNHTPDTEKMQMTPTRTLCQNTPLYIYNENTHIETLLATHTYSTTTLTIKTYSHLKTNIQHYYNKNYKTHTGICMTQ